jgi:hypothetical protein
LLLVRARHDQARLFYGVVSMTFRYARM